MNRQDLPVLLPGLLQAFGSEDFWKLNPNETRRVISPPTVKRGSGIMSFSPLDLNFKDARNFYTSGSLDSFGQVFGLETEKMLFCYDKYSNVEQMQADTTWPPYADFRSRKGLLFHRTKNHTSKSISASR